ncbi:MAG: hypothetical protein P4L55_11380 [Syntrophobacteraceae bacterium]|nr:hypothetical protein [Syntrophobacteraceae bacterium]
MMPNTDRDVRTICGLLDRIPPTNGGTASSPGQWSSDHDALIAQVTAAIITFQTANRLAVIDGVVDPGGHTIRLLNQLAGPGPVTATVMAADVSSQLWIVANPSSLDGTAPLEPMSISPPLTRKLVSVEGSSVKWFGVVIPLGQPGGIIGGTPHIFFTPSPWQGGYNDPTYDQFTAWRGLWDKYTSAIGSQLVASGASQILVIPFYKNSQTGNLGSFLVNWKEVIAAVITAAINDTDPLFLRNNFEFDGISSSSFSNGITTHQNFHSLGTGAASMTQTAFDLDGHAAGSHWRPKGGIAYIDTGANQAGNPIGTQWFVGGRFGKLRPSYPGTSDHNLCPFLLMHGLSMFG